jgi:hypothetical protein
MMTDWYDEREKQARAKRAWWHQRQAKQKPTPKFEQSKQKFDTSRDKGQLSVGWQDKRYRTRITLPKVSLLKGE